MAKKDAYCTQCGSLIQVDDSKEKSSCIFCKAEFETAKALKLNTDPESRLLLQKAAEQKAKEDAAAQKEKSRSENAAMADKAVAKAKAETQQIILKPLPLKVKLIVTAITVSILLIIAAILVPLILNRNAKRDAMNKQIAEEFGIEATSMTFRFNDNREFAFATAMTLTETQVKDTYAKLVGIYAGAYDITEEAAGRKLVMTIYDAAGRYICRSVNGAVDVAFETATPTHTPIPTQSVSSAG